MSALLETELPFHAGEVAVQRRAGLEERAAAGGRHGIRAFMPDQHRDFFHHLPFMIVGSQDKALKGEAGQNESGAIWASVLVGSPGFMESPDPMTLSIAALPSVDDPLADNLKRQAPLGLLGIQPETRRRNRMNGHVTALAPDGFVVSVDQSFGNCPQYIQSREPVFVESDAVPETVEEGALLSTRATALVRASDTFFIASASAVTRDDDPRHGVDVSHRGGRQGFVQVVEENGATVLTAPDFRGNNFFNTLGNIASNPKAGLLFLDFTNGDVLQLTGAAEILWDDPAIARFAGAQRLLRFRATRGRYRRNALPLRWSAAEPAPQLAKTGSWEELNS